MKKVSLIFAMFLGFVATSFAQIGQGECAWTAHYVQPSEKKAVMSFYDIVPLGISDSEGEPAYSVAMTVNFTTQKASNVIVTEVKTGKKWLMGLVSQMNTAAPTACAKAEISSQETRIHRSNSTNLVVYVRVSDISNGAFVYMYKPATQLSLKQKP